jgi:hypothetical protein
MKIALAIVATTTTEPPTMIDGAMSPPAARGGTTSAPAAIPRGRAVWRSPIARPRRSAGNHPITTRPLVALVAAPPMPHSANASASST